MAYQRLQVSSSVDVIPSDIVPIPDPATFVFTGVASMNVAGTLTDIGTSFTTAGIQKNAILYGIGSGKAYFVTSVDSDTQLTVSPAVAASPTEVYAIYNAPTLGATLYVGTAGNISVEMASQRNAAPVSGGLNPSVYSNVPNGSFMPILVTRVNETLTLASNIKALF
jgi:hypothetical protein